MKNVVFTMLSFGLITCVGSATAATSTGSFDVGANVTGSCVVVSADAINLGSYDPTGAHADPGYDAAPLVAEGKISVRCTAGSSDIKVALDQGLNKGSSATCSFPDNRLKSAQGKFLKYTLDAEFTPTWNAQNGASAGVWGCGSSNIQTISSFASSLEPVDMGVKVKVQGGQDVPIGTYSDTVGVTVTF